MDVLELRFFLCLLVGFGRKGLVLFLDGDEILEFFRFLKKLIFFVFHKLLLLLSNLLLVIERLILFFK